MQRLTVSASGRVQGVNFRSSAKSKADELGLVGFAKNLNNGTVQVVAEGEEAQLQQFLHWCTEGSPLAKVTSLSYNIEDAKEASFETFNVLREKSFLKDQATAFTNFFKSFKKTDKLPKHIVIIPDGNRRWAKEHNLPAWKGHEAGMENSKKLLQEVKRLGIQYFTIWGFSTENWDRDKLEVSKLMYIFEHSIEDLRKDVLNNKIRFRHFGRKDRLPSGLLKKIQALEEETKNFSEYNFGLALDYGGRDEVLRAFQRTAQNKVEITEKNVSKALDTSGFPDPDLIIRTGGEKRLSGIMPWQSVYAELAFPSEFYPDFGPEKLQEAILEYSQRERRFGK